VAAVSWWRGRFGGGHAAALCGGGHFVAVDLVVAVDSQAGTWVLAAGSQPAIAACVTAAVAASGRLSAAVTGATPATGPTITIATATKA